MRILNSLTQLMVCLLFLSTSILSSGCEENLNLRDNFPEPFTLYGVLSPDLDTQSIRVYPLDAFPRLDQEVPEGIRFTSVDLMTGEEIIWTDTIDTAPNGQRDLVFWAPFRAEFEHVYHINATRLSDNAQSYADVRIPGTVSVHFIELESPAINQADIHIFIEGDNIRVLKPKIVYTAKAPITRLRDTMSVPRNYQGIEQPNEQGWDFVIDMYQDRFWVQAEFRGGIRCPSIELIRMDLHVIVGDSVWDPPDGRSDPNLLSYPGLLSNVENGLGFIGGGYRIIESLRT